MLCARCETEKGIKEYYDMLLCSYCFSIKTTTDKILEIAWADVYYYNDRLKIEKLIENIYNKGFNDGYRQSMKDDGII